MAMARLPPCRWSLRQEPDERVGAYPASMGLGLEWCPNREQQRSAASRANPDPNPHFDSLTVATDSWDKALLFLNFNDEGLCSGKWIGVVPFS